mmetsp:Transcript_340/g.927  ORF Transcript_340/g.927 Transcript_340/m.927 type:complete len:1681 (+) Transcript_340:130-5172(+)
MNGCSSLSLRGKRKQQRQEVSLDDDDCEEKGKNVVLSNQSTTASRRLPVSSSSAPDSPTSVTSSNTTNSNVDNNKTASSVELPTLRRRTKRVMSRSSKSVQLALENDDSELIPVFEQRGYATTPTLFVNGKRVPEALARQARPSMTLLTFLRTVMHLTGSKLGCAEGGCGACTVVLSHVIPQTKKLRHISINACLTPVLATHECQVTTVEGVGSVKKDPERKLHPIQQVMVDLHGSQCGYCTPGIIMSLYAVLSCHETATVEQVHERLDGNLCRCTGYRPIWDAAKSLAIDNQRASLNGDDVLDVEEGATGPCGIPCRSCPEREECQQECNAKDKQTLKQRKAEREIDIDCSSSTDSKTCCSTSQDKVTMVREQYKKQEDSWRHQPTNMFPQELMNLCSQEQRRPLIVVDDGKRPSSSWPPTPQSRPMEIEDDQQPPSCPPYTWIQPTTYIDLLSIMSKGNCKLVIGNSEIAIETRFKHQYYPKLIHPANTITELFESPRHDESTDSLVFGSCCPLMTIQQTCQALLKTNKLPTNLAARQIYRTCQPIYNMLRWFATTQIRNTGCLGGNLATGSPISDMNPILACMDAMLILSCLARAVKRENTHRNGVRIQPATTRSIQRRYCRVSDFFLHYRTVALEPGELIERIEIPLVQPIFEYVFPIKQARRREGDISIVPSGMRIKLCIDYGKKHFKIQDVALGFGGLAPKTTLSTQAAKFMTGSEFCCKTFEEASDILLQEFALPKQVPGGQPEYRMTLATSFLQKFYLFALRELHADVRMIRNNEDVFSTCLDGNVDCIPDPPEFQESEESGIRTYLSEPKPNYRGSQRYPKPRIVTRKGLEDALLVTHEISVVADGSSSVGKAISHQSAPLHCTGEALYVDDIPEPRGTLHASLVISNQCGCVFQSMGVEKVLAIPGVKAVITHKDIAALGGVNTWGPVRQDEFVFLPLGEVVRTVGQVLGMVVAESLEVAEIGARQVKVQYGRTKSPILVSVEDAIKAGSFHKNSQHCLSRGDTRALDALASTGDTKEDRKHKVGDIVKVSGEFHSGAQEHFYLETQTSMVVPSEGGRNLLVYCSSQAASLIQSFCASATGTPETKVVVRMKRMGGAFGGKETRSVPFTAATAIAAKRLGLPVKLVLPRDVDMKITGTRHVFVSTYHASAEITQNGAKLQSFDLQFYANGGYAFESSGAVVDRAILNSDACYNFPNFRCTGIVCKTSQPAHTAFRGFGAPQGMAATEHVMEHLAVACNESVESFRRSNMYKDGDHTHFGMVIGEQDAGQWNVPRMWDLLASNVAIAERRRIIEEYNSKNKYFKRGLALIPTKFGIAFTAQFLNQGGSLVHLYTDGTVLVNHGGTEMGQGLHTKVCQVAAQAFGIPIEHVHVEDTSTDKVANSIQTVASMSTDTYGMATLDACRQILARLKPVREQLGPGASLKEIAKRAHRLRIDLSARGFFALSKHRCGFDFDVEMPLDFQVGEKPWNCWKGHPFNYFTQGVACSEVEVDLLTGNFAALRSDVIVDVGSSINPTIDIGQVEGAFAQGMGWSTTESVRYGDNDHPWIKPRGALVSSGPGTYKIPSFNDMPEVFNVTLLENSENPFAVHSSKAVGEPPLFLGTSVYFAIRDALASARRQNLGEDSSHFEMRMPMTAERIRMYAADVHAKRAVQAVDGSSFPCGTFQPHGSF